MAALWKQQVPLHPAFAPLNRCLQEDWFLLPHELKLQRAHACALEAAGILSAAEHERLRGALDAIERKCAAPPGPEAEAEDLHTWIEEKLTELAGLQERVTFMCESADVVPLPDESFTVAWSQCSFPHDLSWLKEMDRLLKPGGRLAFTGLIRQAACDDPAVLSLGEISQRVEAMGYRVLSAEDISDMDLEHGWLPALAKLRANEAHYRELMGSDWVHKARASIETDIAAWREARMGNGRVVAVKE